jgi:DNA repair protein RadC
MSHCVQDSSAPTGAEVNAAFREATGDEIISEAQALIARRLRPGAKLLSSPETIEVFLRVFLGPLDYEVFGIILFDSHHRFIAAQNLFRGTIDTCSVHTREVIQSVLDHRASAVVAYHNHPSGIADPSAADRATTRRLKDALALIDVKLLDHFIVGETLLSFSRAGEL